MADDLRVGLLWRGDPRAAEQPVGRNNLLQPLFEAFEGLGVTPQPVVFAEEFADEVRDQLLECDGVIVFVNPIQDGLDRSVLDVVLREASAAGVWVSAHPDVILAMGTKEVLYRTRELGWGTDTDLYNTFDDFHDRFPARLHEGQPRVLKQYRGNGGNGVWKAELVSEDTVEVDHAMQSAGRPKQMPLVDFMHRCEDYFRDSGRLIDQPYQERLGEGLIRCYFVHDEIVGFTHQHPKGLLPRSPETDTEAPVRPPMEDASTPKYSSLRMKAQEWIPQMKDVLGIDTHALPVIWDADFLFGPKDASGADTYVLCEINVSAVWPYPPQATPKLAAAAVASVREARTPA